MSRNTIFLIMYHCHILLDLIYLQFTRAKSLVFSVSLFFLNLHSGGWSPNWVHSACRPLTRLLYLPQVIVRMENLVE
jgi:hypothetical protein